MNGKYTMTAAERERLDQIRGALEAHMEPVKPNRYEHSLGVAETAGRLAWTYGVDEFQATAAGYVHDWDKVLTNEELLARAERYGIKIVGPAERSVALLHGPVAAVELPRLFPDLPPAVFQAVDRHTVGAEDMSPLDMVVFVADAMEPHRKGDYADRLRELAGKVSLTELFFQCFSQGLVYVIQTGRYLYPTAVGIYNTYAMMDGRNEPASN